jgi:DNA-binding CsgD family transcriptional regulator
MVSLARPAVGDGAFALRPRMSSWDQRSDERASASSGMPAGLGAPEDLDVRILRLGSEEYAVLSFRMFDWESYDRKCERLLHCLTRNERSIVSQVVRGKTNSEIARARGTSPRTVGNQLRTIYQKLGVHSRRELCVRVVPGARALT